MTKLNELRAELAAAQSQTDLRDSDNPLNRIQMLLHNCLNAGDLSRNNPNRFHAVKQEIQQAEVLLGKINRHLNQAAEFVAEANMSCEVRRSISGKYQLKNT